MLIQPREKCETGSKASSTSSKPPSSDIVKPPKPPPPQGQDSRRIGGQPGHPQHERVAFPAEAISAGSFDHRLDDCPSCGHDLQPMRTIAPRVVQQIDIVEVPLSIQEHRSHPALVSTQGRYNWSMSHHCLPTTSACNAVISSW